ncbi:minichromosome instability 12 (mis12)-like [Striga hermonthica]|uniref:Minichromosome instability 12 (Mis12)-like n=1 Tax=Striga hermonthica TaxID=68872 RepID=A0A9N7MTB0_STRHE|nr:minichromosome instability 12 (mis12)-like [Striga hermonthica]
MEDSHSESIFDSLNLNPQLFINEVLNIVDDLVDVAFTFFLQEASMLLKTEGTDRSAELSKGISYVRNLIQSTLDQRMQKWEAYCLRVCFGVPEGFSLPKSEFSGDDLPELDAFTDAELDEQLNSLRDRLALVGKESAELGRKVCALERQSFSSKQSSESIDEALQSYLKQDATQLFQDLTNMASDFRARLLNLKRKRIEEIQRDREDRQRARLVDDVLRMPRGNGLFVADLEKLQDFLDEITTS